MSGGSIGMTMSGLNTDCLGMRTELTRLSGASYVWWFYWDRDVRVCLISVSVLYSRQLESAFNVICLPI